MSRALRLALACLIALLWACGGWGCSRKTPELIRVYRISPDRVEAGDLMQIQGEGFAEGQPAEIAFSGEVFSPGRAVKRVEIRTNATCQSQTSIRLVVPEALAHQFADGSEVLRITFRGDVRVAFASSRPDSARVFGTLRGAVLDILSPRPSAKRKRQYAQLSRQFLEHAGFELGAGPLDRLSVRNVKKGSRALSAGLLTGDVLVELDGFRLASADELVVRRGESSAALGVRRGSTDELLHLRLDVRDLRPPGVTPLLGAAVLTGLFALLLWLWLGPLGPKLCWLAERLAERLRPTSAAGDDRVRVRPLLTGLTDGLPIRTALAAVAVFSIIPVRPVFWEQEVDLAVLLVVTSVFSMFAALISCKSTAGFSLRRGLLRAFDAILCLLPVYLALGLSAFRVGSLRPQDLVLAQGGWPSEWYMFGGVGPFCAFWWCLGSCIPVLQARARFPVKVGTRRRLWHSFVRVAGDHLPSVVTSQLCALLFLGGYRLPGVWWESSSTAALAVSILAFQCKSFAVLTLVVLMRNMLNDPLREHARQILVRYGLVATFVAMSLGWVSAWDVPSMSDLRPLCGALRSVLLIAVACVAGYLGLRALGRAKGSPAAVVNPWL